MKIKTRHVPLERWSVTSSRQFDEVVAALECAIGHPDIKALLTEAEAGSLGEMKTIMERALGPAGFMEFIRFDPYKIVAKEIEGAPRIRRFVIGNPLVMMEMVERVPDAASHAPVTILVVEDGESVRLSYDTMASLIAPYGSSETSAVARDLDE